MNQKKSELLFVSMEHIDKAMVESAAEAIAGKKKYGVQRRWMWLGGIAACLAIAIAAGYLISFLQRAFYMPPTYDNAQYTAQDIADIFDRVIDGVPTNAYQEVYAPNAAMLQLSPYSQAEYLPVYQKKNRRPQESELVDFMEKYTPAFETIGGTSLNVDEIVYKKDTYSSPLYHTANYSCKVYIKDDTNGDTHYGATTYGDYNVATLFRPEGLSINGRILQFDDAATDQEIKAILADTIDYLNGVFGTEYKEIRIIRDYIFGGPIGVTIQLYSETEMGDLLDQYSGKEFFSMKNPTIVLEFDKGLNNAGEYQVCDKISYYKPISENGGFEVEANCKRISLEQAEELLANGYVFGGHTCDLCMAAQEKIDLSDYDFVSMEYVFSSYGGKGMPFYTFYKYRARTEFDMECYAKTYVPAIEVSGLKEYFSLQREFHN